MEGSSRSHNASDASFAELARHHDGIQRSRIQRHADDHAGQSPMRQGGTAAQALRETVELAGAAERLGYARYWVAEHHNTGSFAGAAPEILIGQIAAHTSTIHIGSRFFVT